MREVLSAFSGNELTFGIVLGNWLLLTGIGSALGKTAARLKSPLNVLIVALVLVAVLPIADVYLLRTLRNAVFVRGAEVGMAETVAGCFVLLAPYCLIAGYVLTLACRVLAAGNEPSSIGRVYFLDNVGDVIGGVLFTFVLIRLFDHFGVLYFSAFLNLAFACLLAGVLRKPILLVSSAAITAALIVVIVACDLGERSTRIEFAGQRVVFREDSDYGSLVVTELAGQYNFVHNGVQLFSSQDVKAAEEAAHYAMVQRPGAKRVLLISGGVSGTAKEILKHGVDAVDYIELDPLIIEAAKRFVPERLDDPRIRVIATDGRLYVKQTPQTYDVVIANVPEPSTFQLNRFYTREFFAEIKGVLKPDGVFTFSLGHYENYLSGELRDLIATADRTLRQVFARVLILPDGQITFLASDEELTGQIAERIEQAGIENRWVTRDYLQDTLTPRRLEAVASARSDDAPVNRDFDPILYYQRLRLWMSQFSFRFGLVELGLLVLLVLFLVRLRPVPLAMFTTGFAASGLEVVLLVGFQILYGSVYHRVGLIVTMFMIGLGIGSLTMNRLKRRGRRDLAVLELALAVFAGCVPLVLIGLGQLGAAAPIASQVVVPLLTLLLAVLVGLEFPLAGRADFQTVTSTASHLYTADYVGAALGALLVSTLLIPLLGVTAVCLLAAAANLASGAVLLVTSD